MNRLTGGRCVVEGNLAREKNIHYRAGTVASPAMSQLSKYCVVCEISWCRCQQLTALSISTALVTKLLVIEQLLHPALKFTASGPWHNFHLCPSSQQILATPLRGRVRVGKLLCKTCWLLVIRLHSEKSIELPVAEKPQMYKTHNFNPRSAGLLDVTRCDHVTTRNCCCAFASMILCKLYTVNKSLILWIKLTVKFFNR